MKFFRRETENIKKQIMVLGNTMNEMKNAIESSNS